MFHMLDAKSLWKRLSYIKLANDLQLCEFTSYMEGHSQIIPFSDGPKTIMNINKLQSCKIEVVKKFNNVCKRVLKTVHISISLSKRHMLYETNILKHWTEFWFALTMYIHSLLASYLYLYFNYQEFIVGYFETMWDGSIVKHSLMSKLCRLFLQNF